MGGGKMLIFAPKIHKIFAFLKVPTFILFHLFYSPQKVGRYFRE